MGILVLSVTDCFVYDAAKCLFIEIERRCRFFYDALKNQVFVALTAVLYLLHITAVNFLVHLKFVAVDEW